MDTPQLFIRSPVDGDVSYSSLELLQIMPLSTFMCNRMHNLVFYILYFTAGTQTKSRLFLAPGMDIKAFLEFMNPYNR